MKYLFLAAISTIALTTSSCRKCKTCEHYVYQTQHSSGDPAIEVTIVTDYCGKDYDDAPTEVNVLVPENGDTTITIITCTEK